MKKLAWLLLLLLPSTLPAQARYTVGFTKGRYVSAGRLMMQIDRDQLASMAAGQCLNQTTWRTMIDAIEDDGTEFPDTVYFRLAWVMDSLFYLKADTTVVPWASDLYGQVYLARGHTPLDSLTRAAYIESVSRRRKARPASKP